MAHYDNPLVKQLTRCYSLEKAWVRERSSYSTISILPSNFLRFLAASC